MAYIGLNDGVITIPMGRLERVILRNALNRHKDALEKAQKTDDGLGVPNEATKMHLAVIEGDSTWGKGLYDKLSEQASFSEEAHRAHADAVQQADLTKLATDIGRTVEALRGIGLDLDGELFQGMTYAQRGEIQTWARALAQLHTHEQGVWSAVDPAPEGVEPQAAPLFFFDLLAPIAALEREAFIGQVVALHDVLTGASFRLTREHLAVEMAHRTPEENAAAMAWAQREAALIAAWKADESDENDRACTTHEQEIPGWLDAVVEFPGEYVATEDEEEAGEFLADATDEQLGRAAESERDGEGGDDWTAQPGELRTVEAEG